VAVPLVAAAAILPYLVTLSHQLVWDDHYILRQSAELWSHGGLRAVLSAPFFPHPGVPDQYYRPVVNLSFWLDDRLGRGWPGWFHLTNVALHVGCSALSWSLFRRLTTHRVGALAGALLFALHPVHVESVAWVSGRTDSLATLFCLLAVIAWHDAHRIDGRRLVRALTLGASAIAFVAGALSKETALLVPILLVVLDARDTTGRRHVGTTWLRRNAAWLLPYAAGAGVVLALRHAALIRSARDAGVLESAVPLLIDDPGRAVLGFVRMLRLLVLPWPHNALYTPSHVGPDVPSIVAVAALGTLFGWTATRRFRRVGLVGAVWTCLFLAPALFVLSQSAAIVAERYLYLPSVGFCLAAGRLLGEGLVETALRAGHAGAVGAAALIAAGALGYADFTRASVWRDDLTLATDLVRTSPHSALAQNRLGQALLGARRYPEALNALLRAVSLDPLNAGYHNDAGIAFRRLNQPALAVEAFRESLRLDPGSIGTRLNLAYACITLRDAACVEAQRRSLATLDPDARAKLEAVIREHWR
jgi:hypothetical protein